MLNIPELERLGFFRHVLEADLPQVRTRLRDGSCLESLVVIDEDELEVDDPTRRFYRADAEDLAEGEVFSMLGWLSPFLRHEGVAVDVSYAKIRVPAIRGGPRRAGQPSRIGTTELDARGWLRIEGVQLWAGLTPVEKMRVSTFTGGPMEDVVFARGDDGERDLLRVGSQEYVVVDPSSPVDAWTQASVAILSLLNALLIAHGSVERAYGYQRGNNFAIVFATPEMAAVIDAGSPAADRLHAGS